MPNHLVNSSSPYLLQHANNPVDWYPWGEEALGRARDEDKPIFLSIGYAACHWCHVMAHESFEDPETAGYMNQHFINIKVDREERPDLDSVYMQATTAMTGSGGWPMSVFLTPDLKPFYAGTYFPPVERYNMPSFKGLLAGIERAWREQREEITRAGTQVAEHIRGSVSGEGSDRALGQKDLDSIARKLVDNYDWGYGGWGVAPKFPQPMTIEFLLGRAARRHADRESGTQDKELQAALHALRAMARGGMYDVVGGGFARYSIDNLWRVPHFEKMLYDNAQLARAYLHAWQLSGDPFFRRIVDETLAFASRELMHTKGGFFSSLDADSQGVEGKFYVWTIDEVRQVLGDEADFFIAAYGISPKGNWEGNTVLQRALDDSSLAARYSLSPEQVPARLAAASKRLLEARSARVRPGTDDKVLTAWNGLMLASFAEAARVLGNEGYLEVARRNAGFLLSSLRDEAGLHRSWREGRATGQVFLEDYASLVLGLLELYQADFNPRWFAAATELADEMVERFSDPQAGFFDTPSDDGGLLVRPRDLQDNATPSGNSLACEALLKLAAFSENGTYRDMAERQLRLVSDQALQYPTAFGHWLSAADFALSPVKQVALIGSPEDQRLREMLSLLRSEYRPGTLVASASSQPPPPGSPSLLDDRPQVNGMSAAYVCEGFVCRLPVTTIQEFQPQLG
jgi:uncharacterized protein YyaL (SSP411 family)